MEGVFLDRNAVVYLDFTQEKFEFELIESLFEETGYSLEYRLEPVRAVIVISGSENEDCGEALFYSRENFDILLQEKPELLFNWYSEKYSNSIVSTSVRFFEHAVRFTIDLSGSERETEMRLIRLFLKIVLEFGKRWRVIGCLLDPLGTYTDENWDKFFLENYYRECRSDPLDLDSEYLHEPAMEVLGKNLPPIFGLRLRDADRLRSSGEWMQSIIIGETIVFFNPMTAITYNDKRGFALEEIYRKRTGNAHDTKRETTSE